MKKNIVLLALLTITFLFCGCVDNNTNIIDNSFYSFSITQEKSTNYVTEVYTFNVNALEIPYTENVILCKNIEKHIEQLKLKLISEYSKKLSILPLEKQNIYNNKILFNLSTENGFISLKIRFEDKTLWNIFSGLTDGKNKADFEYNVFTIKRTDKKEIFGCLTELGGQTQLTGIYVKDYVLNRLELKYQQKISELKYSSVFNFVTPFKRYHSNANAVAFYQNYYYHQWDDSSQIPDVKIWIIGARPPIWYAISVGAGGLVISGCLIAHSINKRKKKTTI